MSYATLWPEHMDETMRRFYLHCARILNTSPRRLLIDGNLSFGVHPSPGHWFTLETDMVAHPHANVGHEMVVISDDGDEDCISATFHMKEPYTPANLLRFWKNEFQEAIANQWITDFRKITILTAILDFPHE